MEGRPWAARAGKGPGREDRRAKGSLSASAEDDEHEDEAPSADPKGWLFAAGSEDGMEDEVGDDPNTKC